MKTALLTLLFIFPFSFTTKLLPSSSSSSSSFASAEPVLDPSGQTVEANRQYYILPDISDPAGGGPVPGTTRKNLTCTASVVQDVAATSKGLPVKLSPLYRNCRRITTETLLEISFADKIECSSESSKWVLVKEKAKAKGWYVGIGGAREHPGKKILRGVFMIRKSDEVYKIVFCTKVGICGDIVTSFDDEYESRRLVMGADGDDYYPFLVDFVKA